MTTKEILETFRKIAVVGLSSNTWRASHGVSRFMQKMGYEITPVNPNEREVLGQKAYATLDDVPGPLEIVNIFRRSEFVPEVVDAAIRRGAKVVWMQDGAGNPEAARRAEEAGLVAVIDDCMMRQYGRLHVQD